MASLPRLFVSPERLRPHSSLVLDGAEHHYLSRVLRVQAGQRILLLDGQGRSAEGQIARVAEGAVHLALGEIDEAGAGGDAPRLVLLQGLLKGDKLDLVVQKATELGVHRVVPVACQRSVPRVHGDDKRQPRYARIAQAAAQQCRRLDVPEVAPVTPFATVLQQAAPDAVRLFLFEGSAPPLHEALAGPPPRAVELFIGPEGGFTGEEVAAAQAAGFLPCSLGSRILRAETAAIAALAIVGYVLSWPR